jgi:hypothetical protein
MNIELLTSVKERILAEPGSFDMNDWFTWRDSSPCGTAACIAGHGYRIRYEPKETLAEACKNCLTDERSIQYLMADAFDINQSMMSNLCYLRCWPQEFASRYRNALAPKDKAKAAADRIDYFIKTGGE